MSVSIDITSFIEKKFEEIQSCLREKGVSEEIIEAAFGCSDHDEPVAPLPTRRMLGNTTNATSTRESDPSSIKANCVAQNASDKLPQNWVGKSDVVLVLNYTDKSHALFGDFARTHASFKNDYLKLQSWLIFNQSLAFGAGWVVRDKTKAADLRKALKAAKIPFREVEKDVFVSELKKETNNSVVAETSESTESEAKKPKKSEPEAVKPKTEVKSSKSTKEPEPAKPKGRVEPPPKKVETKEVKKVETDTSKIKKNEWGNLADESGLVFKKLPIGEKGKTVAVIIGYQNPEPEGGESELESVLPLTIDHLEEAASKYSYATLNDDVVKKVRKVDKDLADRLQDIQLRTIDDEDDLSDLDEEDLEDEDDDNLDDDEEC